MKLLEGGNKRQKQIRTCIFDDHEQTMCMNHEGQHSPMSHGHNVNHNDMTFCNRAVYSLQSNLSEDDG